jgi:hypothetical protein
MLIIQTALFLTTRRIVARLKTAPTNGLDLLLRKLHGGGFVGEQGNCGKPQDKHECFAHGMTPQTEPSARRAQPI